MHKEKLREIAKNIVKTSQLVKVHEKMAAKTNAKGFKRIAGYDEQIKTLMNKFALSVERDKAGKKVDVPNAMLFFGPKGNGKTSFAYALADQLGCDLIKVKNTLVPEEDLNNLKNAVIEAKQRFQKDGKKSVILIDEFDVFADKTNGSIPELKTVLENISREDHCIVISTTNSPEKINESLLKSGLFHNMAIPPANKENAAAILKHYAEDFAEKNVNFYQLAEHVVNAQPNGTYSNSRIFRIIKGLVTSEQNFGKTLTQKDIHKAFENIDPDIKSKDLELFKRQQESYKDTISNDGKFSKAVESPSVKITEEEISAGLRKIANLANFLFDLSENSRFT